MQSTVPSLIRARARARARARFSSGENSRSSWFLLVEPLSMFATALWLYPHLPRSQHTPTDPDGHGHGHVKTPERQSRMGSTAVGRGFIETQ